MMGMQTLHGKPQTFMAHPMQERLRIFLRQLFTDPLNTDVEAAAVDFFAKHPVPMDDFPFIDKSYSRTILYRAQNSFEAMAARWCKGAVTAIHGHPSFAFYYLLEGELLVDNFEKKDADIVKIDTRTYAPGEYFCIRGTTGTFDNGIHRVTVVEDSLSLHIYSDDALKGEIFTIDD